MSDNEKTSRSRSGSNLSVTRQQNILALLNRGDVVAVGEIAERFGVHTETARRDIRALERDGLLRRVHGGAVATNPSSINARKPISERISVDQGAKLLAAKAALPLFENGMNVFIGSSSTMLLLAEVLASSDKSLAVTTNMVDVGTTLAASPRFTVTLTGGVLNGQLRSIGGTETLRSLKDRFFDLSVIGSSALDFEFGLFATTRAMVDLTQTLAEQSSVMAVAMHRGKFDRRDAHVALALDKVQILATDGEPTDEHQRALESAGVQILIPRPMPDE
ncbi:DeoR/GlpR family DNA-binding transcription regulator [Rhizobium miluonense]|uniref:Transcriptional regulator, DeoR family n=1 Tax=Rhizobium miluonense TaxID=411945 RepID=A0A1C3X026_9HYPH|nr:DeoR/GlpR family DNA-binding transcription regulator [Rhizobium miluonense]SCB45579.1 transcriptional regulator, DeoR family [Rhizobium miluonense]